MAKKKSDKEKDTESKVPSTNKFTAFFKNETIHFVIGLVLVIFSVYYIRDAKVVKKQFSS